MYQNLLSVCHMCTSTMYLLLPPGKDLIDVFLCDHGVFGAKDSVCTVTNHGEHIFTAHLLVAVYQAALRKGEM